MLFQKAWGTLMNNYCIRFISYFLFVVFSLVNIAAVPAQTVAVLGELQTTGKVFISSSTNKWLPAMPTYPLLQDTGIRTEDGSASLFFKDGSRVDLSTDTVVSVSGGAPNYVLHLVKGVVAFSIKPVSSLSISTPSAAISVNSKDNLVQKVGYEKSSRVLGVVSSNEKGTEVRSISGRILVTSSSAGTKTVVTGESMLVGPDSNFKVYKTQVVGRTEPEKEDPGRGAGALLFLGTATAESFIIYGLNDILDHHDHDKPKSPSSFR
jgi:hypothetical protein